MRILLLADVHANWEALLAVQRAEPEPDALFFAGDAVGYGPDPANCVRWLNANATAAVRGNHDDAITIGSFVGFPPELDEAARETLLHARAALAQNDLDGLRHRPDSLMIALGGARFFVVHGTPRDPLGGQLDPALCPEAELHALFDDVPADVVVLGHSHIPALRQFDGRLIVNPGSLGQPRYGLPDSTYAVWDDGHLQIKHLHYDHDAAARRLRLMPLEPEVAEQLASLLETGLVAARPAPDRGLL